MTTVEGGMITTEDYDLYNIMRMKRSHGLTRESAKPKIWDILFPDVDHKFTFGYDGFNVRNTELHAVLGLEQLKRLDDTIAIRNKNYSNFLDNVHAVNEDLFDTVTSTTGMSNFAFPFFAKDKDKIERRLDEAGIETRPIVGGNMLRQPFIRERAGVAPESLFWTEKLHQTGFYVGNNAKVTTDMINYLGEVVSV
jgi:CDP-6-deoxy-D-xylo-4-hexulose-3-dehydrase